MSQQDELLRRRQSLLQQLPADAAAVVFAAQEQVRSKDVHYPFRQNSHFLYLTGFNEPDSVAVFLPNRKEGEYLLFVRPRDAERETWEGRRAGVAGAKELHGADEAYDLAQLDSLLPSLLAQRTRLYGLLGEEPEQDARLIRWLSGQNKKSRDAASPAPTLVWLQPLLSEMRLIKSPHEIDLLRQAASITALAHKKAMQATRPGMNERQLHGLFLNTYLHHGSQGEAYPSIIAGGANACILHYTENNCLLNDGELLLIDAGAELDGYAADLTRTFPINGRFSPTQKQLYDLVLKAQLAAIERVKPGIPWDTLQECVVEILTTGLIELGILHGDLKELIANKAYLPFYMHTSGHWLGLDVHDDGAYRRDGATRTLEPGMVLTVEPGLYIPAGSANVAQQWWNIGIRIEDDVLVTAQGHEVLTAAVPKTTSAIEELMQEEL